MGLTLHQQLAAEEVLCSCLHCKIVLGVVLK
jgi:hypothetical protein